MRRPVADNGELAEAMKRFMAITMKIYAHLKDEHLHAAMKNFERQSHSLGNTIQAVQVTGW